MNEPPISSKQLEKKSQMFLAVNIKHLIFWAKMQNINKILCILFQNKWISF